MVNDNQTGHVNLASLNEAVEQTVIHIDLTKTIYGITSNELTIIESGSSSLWKDLTLSGLGIGIPCLINAWIEHQKNKGFNAEIFCNSLIGGICIVVAIIFGILWLKSDNVCKVLIGQIRSRPQYRM